MEKGSLWFEKKMVPNNMPRYVVCPVCEIKVPYAKRGSHQCLRIDFHEMDSKIKGDSGSLGPVMRGEFEGRM